MKHFIKAIGSTVASAVNVFAMSAGAGLGIVAALTLMAFGDTVTENKNLKEELKQYKDQINE